MGIFRDNSDNVVEHDRSIEDRRRHRQLVEKTIKENLGDILSEESIIGESKNRKFKNCLKLTYQATEINNSVNHMQDKFKEKYT